MGIFDKIKKIGDEISIDKLKKTTDEATISLQTQINNVSGNLKPQIIQQAVNINYDAISTSLRRVNRVHLIPECVILSMEILQKASDDYKASLECDKDEKFLNCIVNNIDAKFVLENIKPIVKLIPAGGIIVMLLKLILKLKK
jgi:hypothetical protein